MKSTNNDNIVDDSSDKQFNSSAIITSSTSHQRETGNLTPEDVENGNINDVMNGQVTLMEEDYDEDDFDDDMNGVCTQGHHDDGAFMFGSEAGLFTQAVDSDSENDDKDEQHDDEDVIKPLEEDANDAAKQDKTYTVDVEKEAADSVQHCSDDTLLCGDSADDVEDKNGLVDAADDERADSSEVKPQNFKSSLETLDKGNTFPQKESECHEGQGDDGTEMNLQGFTETTQIQDETVEQDNRTHDDKSHPVDVCENMTADNRQDDGRASPLESTKQIRGENMHGQHMAPASTFEIDNHSYHSTNDDAVQSGFTENTQTQENNTDVKEDDACEKNDKLVPTSDFANGSNKLDSQEMDEERSVDTENQQPCTTDCDLAIGKYTGTKDLSDTTKNVDDDLDAKMEESLPRIERKSGNMLSIFAGDTQSIPSQLVLTMDEENKMDNSPPASNSTKPNEIFASAEQHDTVEPYSEEAPESMDDAQHSHNGNYSQVFQPTKPTDPQTFENETNDSFYAGSTEKMPTSLPETSVETNLNEAKRAEAISGKSSPSNRDKCVLPSTRNAQLVSIHDKTDVDSVHECSPSQNKDADESLGHPSKLVHDKDAGNPRSTAKEVLFEEIMNPTNTPMEDNLSYPKDYLTDEVIQKSSTMTKDTLSITPQSQILLEPISTKRFQFSVMNKVVGLGETPARATCNDTLACSSDDEIDNEVITDSTQVATTPSNSETVSSGANKGRDPVMMTRRSEDNLANKRSSTENNSHDLAMKESNRASGSDTDGEDDYIPDARRKECNISSLDDTQPDDEDNKPLIYLRRVKRGHSLHRRETIKSCNTTINSSDEEREFTEDMSEQQSQNTRDIKYQLQKLDQYDIKNMAEKLLQTPVANQKVLEEKIEALTAKCNILETRNKELSREKTSITNELTAAKCQIKEKNVLIAQMKQRLDEYQPLLEAVQKLNMKSNSREIDETPPLKKTSKSRSKHHPRENIEAGEKLSPGDDYSTPNHKTLDRMNEINVVSVSNQKRKKKSSRKSNVKGNMTFSNLWKILKEHGWSYRNAPMPLAGQVYVPPDGSVKIGSKAGVDFYEANDLLWAKAQELGIIDDNSQDEENEHVVISASTPTRKSPGMDSHIVTDYAQIEKINNSELIGKGGSLTEMSLYNCASIIKDFLKLGSEGRFMRNLFTPLWKCISDDQGCPDKTLAWKYCRSKGAGNLGRDYWFCPPNSKGSKGQFGVDYFTTEEAVVCHIAREVKNSTLVSVPHKDINHLEIKLSRAIEQHIPFDEIKSSASSTGRPNRRMVLSEPEKTSSFSALRGKGSAKSMINQSFSNSTKLTNQQAQLKSRDKNDNGAVSRTVTFSQNAAKVLDPQATTATQWNMLPDYDNLATNSGIKKLLNTRRQSQMKRKGNPPAIEGSRKKMKPSPSTICHLTQNPDDEHILIEPNLYQPRWIKRSLNKDLPLYGLCFFGSGVGEKVRKTVDLLGGIFLADISGYNLKEENVKRKLFFLSDVNRRRTHKYILACALGVPMLNFEWLFELEEQFNEYKRDNKKLPNAFDSYLFNKYRLPLGLSSASGLFPLQKARHAKYWSRPSSENGSLLFKGMNIMIALEDYELEKKWNDIIKSIGASLVSHNDIGKKGVKLDKIIVDSVNMPPHVTAVPLRVGKVLSKAASYQPNAVIVDLSWATQCIVQRTLLQTDEDRRYRVDMSKSKSPAHRRHIVDVYSIKVNQFNGLTRYEVGDTVNFARNGDELSQGRIIAIKCNTKTRRNTVEVKVLERHNECELMEGGKGFFSVTVDEKALQGHIVLLAGKDFVDVAWSKSSNVYLQKKS